jgi:hypothetical protein
LIGEKLPIQADIATSAFLRPDVVFSGSVSLTHTKYFLPERRLSALSFGKS